MNYTELATLLTRPIAFHRIFAAVGGGACAGLFLSQAFYWTPRTKDADGWFYKTQQEWEEETALTRREQESVRKQLAAKNLLEEKKEGVPCRLYYRINKEGLMRAINAHLEAANCSEPQFVQKRQAGMAESAKLERAKAPNYIEAEITPEITPENTHTPSLSPPSAILPLPNSDRRFAPCASEKEEELELGKEKNSDKQVKPLTSLSSKPKTFGFEVPITQEGKCSAPPSHKDSISGAQEEQQTTVEVVAAPTHETQKFAASAPQNKPDSPSGILEEMLDPEIAGRKRSHRGEWASDSRDVWMQSNSQPIPAFVQWLLNKRLHEQKNLNESQRSYVPSVANIRAEIRNNYVHASDLWEEYLIDCNRVFDTALQVQASGSQAKLPSWMQPVTTPTAEDIAQKALAATEHLSLSPTSDTPKLSENTSQQTQVNETRDVAPETENAAAYNTIVTADSLPPVTAPPKGFLAALKNKMSMPRSSSKKRLRDEVSTKEAEEQLRLQSSIWADERIYEDTYGSAFYGDSKVSDGEEFDNPDEF